MGTIGEFAKGYILGYVGTKAIQMVFNGMMNSNAKNRNLEAMQQTYNPQMKYGMPYGTSYGYYDGYGRCF